MRSHNRAFCTSQQLSILTERTDTHRHLSGEQFWLDRHPDRGGSDKRESPWLAEPRTDLLARLQGTGDSNRLAVVCAGGLGKTTNLRYFAGKLAAEGSRQVPFFFALDDRILPDNADVFFEHTLPERIKQANTDPPSAEQLLHTLRRLRAAGRLTLLLDSIDQAHPAGLLLVKSLLAAASWARCPIVLSGRPHAFFDLWQELIGDAEAQWRFVRIEPLAEADRRLLLDRDGVRRYNGLPAGGRELMANPRNIEYVLKCAVPDGPYTGREPDSVVQYTLHDLRTASHVYAGATEHMVENGIKSSKARKLGRRKDRPEPQHPSGTQIEFTLNLLGVLAFTMYCFPLPPGKRPGKGRKRKETPRPNVSHIPAKQMTAFKKEVLERMKGSGMLGESDYDGFDYGLADLDDDLDALGELNAEVQFDLLDSQTHRRGDFRWYDRSLQEFFAARFLARYGQPKDHEHLRRWRYGSLDDTARTLYQPLWGFLVEMPRAIRRNRVWVPAVSVLFESPAPRCSEMIYRSWPTLLRSKAGRKVLREWRQEYQRLLRSDGPKGDIARSIRDGFRPCPKDPAEIGLPFLMGSPADEEDRSDDELQHEVTLTAFQMHRYPVTNAQYELFDPDHRNHRWREGAPTHPGGEEAADHPVVNVTWFDAEIFARWTKNHLPTEAQWEYACRGGRVTYQTFHFGNSLSSNKANFDGNIPYGGAPKGPWLRQTTRVGSYEPNRFRLCDMHGNVWEWCQDWYDAAFYTTAAASGPDPVNEAMAPARVLRGGSWGSNGWCCRSAARGSRRPEDRGQYGGFRLAAVPRRALEPSKAK